MLVGNGRRLRSNPLTYSTALQQQFPNSGPVQKNLFYGSGGLSPLSGLPVEGVNSNYAQLLPLKSGGIASRSNNTDGVGELIAAGALGVNLGALVQGSGLMPPAPLILTTSGSATINGLGSVSSAALVALLDASTNIISGSSFSGALRATGRLQGAGQGFGTISLTPYATGTLAADITPFTDLSPQTLAAAVWNSTTAAYTEVGSMGKAVSDAGGAGNPWSSPVVGNTGAGSFGELVRDISIEQLTASSDISAIETLILALQIKVDELHRIEGLDDINPMTVTPTTRTAGDITLHITGDGVTSNTVTRES